MGDEAHAYLGSVVEAFDGERIAWGSNCPAAEQPLTELDGLRAVLERRRARRCATTSRRRGARCC
ncbi:hypothetical protein AB0910_20650 [Streptomyces sp. NPDC047002]|uniref:hypothetical protein n=1 Tax=Streptomyces sp. NPDC047002 TaxID=3155475 RepID=UPI0034559B2D